MMKLFEKKSTGACGARCRVQEVSTASLFSRLSAPGISSGLTDFGLTTHEFRNRDDRNQPVALSNA
jgi:hypothetical protein